MSFVIEKANFVHERKRCHKTYVIRCPGTYTLKENISFRSNGTDIAAILIDSSDVILNLNGKVLRQSSRDKNPRFNGIIVKTGHHNVTILGSYGSIQNFSQRGIYVEGGNDYITIGDETLLTVTGCGYGTPISLFDGNRGLLQAGVQLGDMEFFAFPAFKLEDFHGVLNHLKVTNLVSSKNCYGLALGEGYKYSFENCDISNNYEYRPLWSVFTSLNAFFRPDAVVCYGLVYFSNPDLTPPPNVGINNIVFKDCKFNNNVADATKVDGGSAYVDAFIMAVNFRGLKIKNCQFNSNETKLNDSGLFNQTRGLVLGEGISTVIEDSEFLNNIGGNYVSGFNQSGLIANNSGVMANIFQGKSITLRNCVASGNVAAPTLNAEPTPFPPGLINSITSVGFQIRYPSGLTLIDCVAENNYVTLPSGPAEQAGPTVSALADGIIIYSDPQFPCNFANNIEITGAKLSKNRVLYDPTILFNAGISATSAGIRVYDDLNENIIIQNSVISNNLPGIDEQPYPLSQDGPAGPIDYISAGIDLFNAPNSGTVKTGPSFVSITNNEIQSNGTYGVFSNLDLTKIQNNRISYHDKAGVWLAVGLPVVEGGPDTPAALSSILDNTFVLNGIAVVDAAVFTDSPSSSLIAGNKAFSYQGTDIGYLPNNPPPVATGTLEVFPPRSEFEWTNINIASTSPAPIYTTQECQPLARNGGASGLALKSKVKSEVISAETQNKKYEEIHKKLFLRK
jgi:hypothetical protein